MARTDFALFAAYHDATHQVGNHLEITTADFIQLAGYPVTPVEANKFILAQIQRVKVISEGEHGKHIYRYSH